jgi:hypothetical protein
LLDINQLRLFSTPAKQPRFLLSHKLQFLGRDFAVFSQTIDNPFDAGQELFATHNVLAGFGVGGQHGQFPVVQVSADGAEGVF